MKGLQSKEDADVYIDKVEKTLMYLYELSNDAGLGTHAALFLTVYASFMSSMEEFNLLKKAVMEYNDGALKRHFTKMMGGD